MDLEFEKLIGEECSESSESEFQLYGKKFKTKKFKTDKEANDFMSKDSSFGVIGTKGKDADYEVHVAKMDDEGEDLSEASKQELFSKEHLDKLASEYSSLKTIDPSQPTYAKLTKYLDGLSQEHLKQIAGAKINFLSGLARNRVKKEGSNQVDEAKMSDKDKEAYEIGKKAFKDGKKAIPALDKELMDLIRKTSTGIGSSKSVLKMWSKGWVDASLATPVSENNKDNIEINKEVVKL